jgi:hypothetical protein
MTPGIPYELGFFFSQERGVPDERIEMIEREHLQVAHGIVSFQNGRDNVIGNILGIIF